MFCSKCGNPLPNEAKFCSTCGTPVNTAQEASPVPQQPQSIPDETVNTQAPKPEPLMAAQNFSVQMSGAAARGKKSKKGLVIGLSVGLAVLLIAAAAVILAVLGLFNPTPSSPFPVLEVGKTQIYYGEDLDQLEEAFPNMEKNTEFFYSLKQSGDQRVDGFIRADKETGETKLVYWRTTMNHTGLSNGISVGDSYEKILTEYPDAMCSTEMGYGGPAHKYNPETDPRVSFTVYMDENGNTYSPVEYEKKRADRISEGNFDFAKWYGLYFTVENGRITMIDFGDLMAIQVGE